MHAARGYTTSERVDGAKGSLDERELTAGKGSPGTVGSEARAFMKAASCLDSRMSDMVSQGPRASRLYEWYRERFGRTKEA